MSHSNVSALTLGCEDEDTVAGVNTKVGLEYQKVDNRPPQPWDMTLSRLNESYWPQ